MRTIYIDPNGVQHARRPQSLAYNGNTYCPPTDEQLVAAGWEIREILDPIPEPPTKEQQYKWRVQELIAERYDVSDELAIQRQRDTKAEEFAVYNAYCEECKQKAYKEIYE